MRISFACPSCNASGSVDAVHIGKQVRCKYCKARFAIPDQEAAKPDVYALEEPSGLSASGTSASLRGPGFRAGPRRFDEHGRSTTTKGPVRLKARPSECSG